MFKVLRTHQNGLLLVFMLLSAVFLTTPGLYSSLFRSSNKGLAANAQGVSQPVPPLSAECSERCDTDKDGTITRSDLVQYSGNPDERPRFQFCTQQCPFEGNVPVSPSVSPVTSPSVSPAPSINPADLSVGDCSGVVAGTPDGVVDAKDIDQFRRELGREATDASPLTCDFDKNNLVDIIDFTNYIRVGYVAHASQTPSVTPSPSVTPETSPSVSPSVQPSPSVSPSITPSPASSANDSTSPVPSGSATP
ncbi:hypothetical protein KBC70_02500 [Candidatus Woesebacteria bacterium]|nr:hypothetical protein [Candidatus Woesebacteria bacterium]